MNAGGLVIVIVGTLVLTQVLGGEALARLGIAGAVTGTQASPNVSPDGIPNVDPTKPFLRDPQGRVY